MEREEILKSAISGDINAFETLFAEFKNQLKSYLYRLLTDRNDVDDLTHDTYIRAFTRISTFNRESSLKTWVFKIATNLAYDHLRKLKRWQPDAQDRGADLAIGSEEVRQSFWKVHDTSSAGAYEMREHIDFCFTCISKTLPIENQVALILKEMYDFQIKEIGLILGKTQGVIKHLLNDARNTMTDIFDSRCALINKNGVCHQCSHINAIFNPKQDQQAALMKLDLVKASKKYNRDELFALRTTLVKALDPLQASGTDLHDSIMNCVRTAIGEKADFFDRQPPVKADESNGYDGIAEIYIQGRGLAINGIGASTARAWARTFNKGSVILDLGCGTGIPVTKILLEEGLKAYAIDASPKMVEDFRQNLPDVPIACEAVERSTFFDRSFDGIIAVGLLFLLPEETQRALIPKIAAALNHGGKLLFTAPLDKHEWKDVMTQQPSLSLGQEQYRTLMVTSGLVLAEEFRDEGGNHYYSAIRP